MKYKYSYIKVRTNWLIQLIWAFIIKSIVSFLARCFVLLSFCHRIIFQDYYACNSDIKLNLRVIWKHMGILTWGALLLEIKMYTRDNQTIIYSIQQIHNIMDDHDQ